MKRPVRFDRQRSKPRREPGPARLVEIEKPVYGGQFLARDEGKAVFVPLALPGERASVRTVEEKRGYATAEIEELVEAAPERIAPRCPHFGPCGGCHYQHTGYETQLRIKQAVLRETLERAGVPAPAGIAALAGQPWGYRNRIRLAFDAAGNPGYRGRRSHAVIAIRECPIAAPLLERAALALKEPAALLRPREIALFCDAAETAMLVSVFVDAPARESLDEFATALRARIPELAGAEMVVESGPNRPPRIAARWGAASLFYRAAGFDYRVDHGAFFQVNRWLVDELVERVTAGLEGVLAWDLFAGVGLFARRLTCRFEQVVAVESAPPAAEALAANLAGTSGTGVKAPTLEFLKRNQDRRPDLVVVDPPRTGLGADVTALLAEASPAAVVYVSCDPATLGRDLRGLLQTGYGIESVTLADLFPQTFHLETVVRLHRS